MVAVVLVGDLAWFLIPTSRTSRKQSNYFNHQISQTGQVLSIKNKWTRTGKYKKISKNRFRKINVLHLKHSHTERNGRKWIIYIFIYIYIYIYIYMYIIHFLPILSVYIYIYIYIGKHKINPTVSLFYLCFFSFFFFFFFFCWSKESK